MKQSVQVLMSTYNGERYIQEQIDSIFSQEDVDVYLYIRDDNSSDGTVDIIKDNMKNNSKIKFISGENLGYERSFMELVYSADEYDYYAFADQDDVWNQRKLCEAISRIKEINYDGPVMYYSMMTEVTSDLKVKEKQQFLHYPLNKKMNLFQNFVQGSTIVFNKECANLVKRYKLTRVCAQDVWIPLLCNYFGKLVFDERSFILYRIHDDAVTNQMKKKYWKKLFKRIFSNDKVDNLAIDLLSGYEDILCEQDKAFLYCLKNFKKNKLKLMLDKDVRKLSVKGTLMLKMAILLNRME